MRGAHVLKAAMAVAVLPLVVPTAAGADTAPCVGTATVFPPTPTRLTGGEGATVARFEFTGTHDFCLADGTVVLADMAGTMQLVTHTDGTAHMTIHSTLTIPGGTIDGLLLATIGETFDGTVHGFHGTGVLTGVSGTGITYPTGPNTFESVVDYRYP